MCSAPYINVNTLHEYIYACKYSLCISKMIQNKNKLSQIMKPVIISRIIRLTNQPVTAGVTLLFVSAAYI